MIPTLRGWRRAASGDRITLAHPEGDTAAVIRYRESVRPLARMSVIVEDLLARTPGFEVGAVGPIERGVSDEGEYTARVVVDGTIGGAPARREIAAVFGDDDHALLTGASIVPARWDELAAAIRFLLEKDAHGRGVRRRRYLYTPPPGWQGRARGLTTEWQPPGHPREPTLLHVLPAHPVDDPVEAVLAQTSCDDAEAGLVAAAPPAPEEIVLPSGLRGASWDMTLAAPGGRRILRTLVALRDARHLYVSRVETAGADPRPGQLALLGVLRSIEPLPAPGRSNTRGAAPVAAHWAE
jgi:hypothetical protein